MNTRVNNKETKKEFLTTLKSDNSQMTTNGAKTFAMKEANHILELMEKLLSMDKESSPSDYYSLESEL